VWPSTNSKTISNPPCVNAAKEFVYRECTEGQWGATPECAHVQFETVPNCPEGFTELDSLCYIVKSRSECPFPNVLPFSSYKHITKVVGPVWMPVRHNALGFMQWTEASSLYGSDFTDYWVWVAPTGNDCVLYINETSAFLAPCDESRSVLCVYDKDQLQNEFCEEMGCVQSDFTNKTMCTCMGLSWQGSFSNVELLQPFRNTVESRIRMKNCTIGLKKSSGSYIWTNSKQEISYTYWSRGVVFDDTHIYGALTPQGWILTEQPEPCFLYEKSIEALEPSLHLSPGQNGTFFLVIENPGRLQSFDLEVPVFCFTDANPLELLYRYPPLQKLFFENNWMATQFAPIVGAPGNYWCEAFGFIDSKIIKSEVLFHSSLETFFEFVAIFKLSYDYFEDPLGKSTTDFVQNYLFPYIESQDYLKGTYAPRMMKIGGLDNKNQTVLVNVHLTSTNLTQTISQHDEFEKVKEKILAVTTLNNRTRKNIEMVDFLSATFCSAESGNLSWPQTGLGSEVASVEFCFKRNGVRATRLCGGDFMNGSRWSKVEPCETFAQSTVTNELVSLLNLSKGFTRDVHQISRDYKKFLPLDVYLVGQVYSRDFDHSDNVWLPETINNLLRVNKNVLREAQVKLRATDTLLSFVERVMNSSRTGYDHGLRNFVFVSLNVSKLSGLVFVQNGQKTDVRQLSGDHTVGDVLKIKHLKGAVWLHPKLRNQIGRNNRVSFSLFYDDRFFQEPHPFFQTSGVIFGVSLPGFARLFEGPVQILHRVDNQDDRRQSCAYWRYGSDVQGAWREERKVRRYSSFSLCEFWRVSHFAMVLSPKLADDGNVTDDLIDVLNSNDSTPNTIAKLYNISERYDAFRPVDVSYTEQILHKVSEDEEIDLQVLAYIVSNLHQIKRSVLLKSQTEVRATDMVLSYVDMIIKKHRYDSRVATLADNFMVFTIDPNELNFTGLAVHNHKHTFDVQILEGNVTIDDVSSLDSFDSAVVFSDDLKRQLVNGSKVIVTVFANDALFNEEDSPSKLVSKVFGVILPEIGEFQGPISVLHKTKYGDQCVHWFYNQVRGFWKEDNASKNASHLAQCDYWHTTHFALLLLAKDDFSNESYIATDVLEYITTINSVFSLVCLAFVIFTAVLFKHWRSNTGNQILLHFVFVSILQIGVFYVSGRINRVSEDYLLCTVVGVILHYSIISQFCWMLIIAVLQFRRFVTVLGGPPRYVLFKSCICGWVLPLFPVVSVLVFDRSNYVSSKVGLCYPSGWGLYLGVWLPIAFIIVVNCIIFINILHNVIYKKTEHSDVPNTEVMYQWRLAVLLFFMFGLTWVFGFVSNFEVGVVFVYLFCFTATLQGFIIFLFFIVCNSNTRYLYTRVIKKHCNKCKQ
jgi:hypothetical protein